MKLETQRLAKSFLIICIILFISTLLGATGYLVKNTTNKISQPQVSVVPESTATSIIKDGVNDWKEYINNEMGFSILYPPILMHSTLHRNSIMDFFRTDAPTSSENGILREYMAIGFYNRAYSEKNVIDKDVSFNELILEVQGRVSSDSLMEKRNITISGLSAIEFVYKTSPSGIVGDNVVAHEIYIKKDNGKVFTIGANIIYSKKEIYEPVLTQILSTFKFIK